MMRGRGGLAGVEQPAARGGRTFGQRSFCELSGWRSFERPSSSVQLALARAGDDAGGWGPGEQ